MWSNGLPRQAIALYAVRGQGLLLTSRPHAGEQMRALLNGSTVYAELPRRQRRQSCSACCCRREPMKTAPRSCLFRETLAADLTKSGSGYPRMR